MSTYSCNTVLHIRIYSRKDAAQIIHLLGTLVDQRPTRGAAKWISNDMAQLRTLTYFGFEEGRKEKGLRGAQLETSFVASTRRDVALDSIDICVATSSQTEQFNS